MKKELILGLMSGTSADGLSIALCEAAGRSLKVAAFGNYPYPPALQARIIAAKDMAAPALSALNFELGRLWAGMVKSFCRRHRAAYKSIAVIGSHGQTVWHSPGRKGHTLQIGEASFIAEETGRPVVCDFRPADMAAGGEGAPLIPFLDEFLFGGGSPVALQNIGGVGNIAFAGRGVKTFGFDTGPGNTLLDQWMGHHNARDCDDAGQWAASGKSSKALLEQLLTDPFFAASPPKSTGREHFHLDWLHDHLLKLSSEPTAVDIQATLVQLSALSITQAVIRHLPQTQEIYVCGGGAHNQTLHRRLAALLPSSGVQTTDALGVDGDYLEAVAFAWLAQQTLHGKPASLPLVTGARHPCILGAIYPA